MEIPNYSLPQITPEVLDKLTRDELLPLSIKLLKDLKELHDRANQNPKNSSRPSSSMPPWEGNDNSNKSAHKTVEASAPDLGSESNQAPNEENDDADIAPQQNSTQPLLTLASKNNSTDKSLQKKTRKATRRSGLWTQLGTGCY